MISVILAEDQAMLRQAMVQLLQLTGEIEVVLDTNNGSDAFNYIQKHQPDIAILDIEMPEMTGLEVLGEVKKKQLSTKVIIVTTFKRPGYFERAVAHDVDAYVLKEQSIDELVKTMHDVMNGKKIYSDSLMTTLFQNHNPLTDSEQLILKEVGEGYSNKEIAMHLYLSNGTVRNYLSTIIDKLEAENRFEAWKIAIEKGWII